MRAFHTCVLLLCCLLPVVGQEICDNGIDDDGDGLVDLNDPDCQCNTYTGGGLESLVANPSFEEFTCCPSGEAQLSCATGWQQATQATTDFFHACGWFPPLMPLPLPDGAGCAGTFFQQGFKEYLGAVLQVALQAGEPYRTRVHVAAALVNSTVSGSQPIDRPVTEIVLYGSAVPPSFPLQTVDCPQAAGWQVLGSVPYEPDGSWQRLDIGFTPAEDIVAVMLGAPCELPEGYAFDQSLFAPYIFWDRFLLAGDAFFLETFITLTGDLCDGNAQLLATSEAAVESFQWYLEGVALVGQTAPVLDLSAQELGPGTYQVRTTWGDLCAIASITIGPSQGVEPEANIAPAAGCAPLQVGFADITPIPGITACHWDFGDGTGAEGCSVEHVYSDPGGYDVTLTITLQPGCTYALVLPAAVDAYAPPIAAFTAWPQPATVDNTTIQFTAQGDPGLLSWWWQFDTIPPFNAEGQSQEVVYPAMPGSWPVLLEVVDANGCSSTLMDTVFILPATGLAMPNVFSPNGDGINDRFHPVEYYGTPATLIIYDRWGDEVFRTRDMRSGWGGRINGTPASEGTYYWVLLEESPMLGELRSAGVVLLLR